MEREFTDPLTTRTQIIVKDIYTSANYEPFTPLACFRVTNS
jgi:hypothetical protein